MLSVGLRRPVSAGSAAAGTALYFCGDKPVGSSNRGAEPYHEDVCIGWIAKVMPAMVCLGAQHGPLWMAEEENIMLIVYLG